MYLIDFNIMQRSYDMLAIDNKLLVHYLSEQLRQPDITFGQCKRLLKTFMFG